MPRKQPVKIKRIYVFGNSDYQPDGVAIKLAKKLQKKIKDIEFVFVNPNEDVPFADEDEVVIMDAVEGLEKVEIFSYIDGKLIGVVHELPLQSSVSSSVHDYDLGFQLQYLQKLGKLGKVTVIGLPMTVKLTDGYETIHSILRKLVAQDMQGS